MRKHDGRALALRQALEGGFNAGRELTLLKLPVRPGFAAGRLGNRVDILGAAPAAQAVEAEIGGNAVEPGAELRLAGLPSFGMGPDAKKHFLCDLFGIGMVAEHAAGKRKHAREVPVHQRTAGRLVARCDSGHEFIVRRFVQPYLSPCWAL